MIAKKYKILMLAVSVILLIGITVTAIAVNGGKKPSVQAGEFRNLIADRIEVTVENTQFTLKKSSENAEEFTLTFFFSLKKTQADFYAMLNSFSLSGIAYDNIVFTALNESTEGKTLDSLLLPAKDGEPELLKWQADVTLSVAGTGSYSPVIILDYTSGMTKDTAQQKIMDIPLKITVE